MGLYHRRLVLASWKNAENRLESVNLTKPPECGDAPCLKCGALRRKARLAFEQNNPGEMGTYRRRMVLHRLRDTVRAFAGGFDFYILKLRAHEKRARTDCR